MGIDASSPSDSGTAADDGGSAGEDASAAIDAGGSDGGRARGHAVIIGWSFATPEDAFDQMLGNAIFLSERPASTLRVVEYVEHAVAGGWEVHARSVIDSAGTSRGRTVTRTTLASATGLATALSSADVLFVPVQAATEVQIRTMAGFWREPLLGFLDAGGVIVVASAGVGSSGGYEWVLLEAPELFSFGGGRTGICCSGTPVALELATASDPVAAGVLSPFSANGNNLSFFPGSARGTLVVRSRDDVLPVVRHLVR